MAGTKVKQFQSPIPSRLGEKPHIESPESELAAGIQPVSSTVSSTWGRGWLSSCGSIPVPSRVLPKRLAVADHPYLVPNLTQCSWPINIFLSTWSSLPFLSWHCFLVISVRFPTLSINFLAWPQLVSWVKRAFSSQISICTKVLT